MLPSFPPGEFSTIRPNRQVFASRQLSEVVQKITDDSQHPDARRHMTEIRFTADATKGRATIATVQGGRISWNISSL